MHIKNKEGIEEEIYRLDYRSLCGAARGKEI